MDEPVGYAVAAHDDPGIGTNVAATQVAEHRDAAGIAERAVHGQIAGHQQQGGLQHVSIDGQVAVEHDRIGTSLVQGGDVVRRQSCFDGGQSLAQDLAECEQRAAEAAFQKCDDFVDVGDVASELDEIVQLRIGAAGEIGKAVGRPAIARDTGGIDLHDVSSLSGSGCVANGAWDHAAGEAEDDTGVRAVGMEPGFCWLQKQRAGNREVEPEVKCILRAGRKRSAASSWRRGAL